MDLGRPEPVYGVVTRGSLDGNEHVNSFYVLTSVDNQTYSYVHFLGMPEVSSILTCVLYALLGHLLYFCHKLNT